MPVTFYPAPQNAIESLKLASGSTLTPKSLLTQARQHEENPTPVKELLQSSFGRQHDKLLPAITAHRNGFVDTVVQAYNRHHALVIRPDDVWLCILSQFSLFVNGEGRAERLRHLFVAHEGKKKLTVTFDAGSRYSIDFGLFARLMTGKIHDNVVDPALRTWILPDFSTTTPNDTVVASVLMMASLKAYFEYYCTIECGLPQVTLLGTQDDWIRIFDRLDKLQEYGPETAAWAALLRPILARFVKAFEPKEAESKDNADFWQRVVHYQSGGSGPDYVCGWITAFAVFGSKGQWLGDRDLLKRYQSESAEVADSLTEPLPEPKHPPNQQSTPIETSGAEVQTHKDRRTSLTARLSSRMKSLLSSNATNKPAQKTGSPYPVQSPAQILPVRSLDYPYGHINATEGRWTGLQLEIDGISYRPVDTDQIPPAYAEVPVNLDDNGKKIDTLMVAGLVGMSAEDASGEDGKTVKRGKVAPVAAWWMFVV